MRNKDEGLCRAETGREEWPYVAVCAQDKGHDGRHQTMSGAYEWNRMDLKTATDIVVADQRASYPDMTEDEAVEHALNTTDFTTLDGANDNAEAYRTLHMVRRLHKVI